MSKACWTVKKRGKPDGRTGQAPSGRQNLPLVTAMGTNAYLSLVLDIEAAFQLLIDSRSSDGQIHPRSGPDVVHDWLYCH